MEYSLNLIALPSEADELIAMATRDKRNLLNRKETLLIRSEDSVKNSAERFADLAAARISLANTNAQIATLPEGVDKEDQITKKMELEVRIRKLSGSNGRTNIVAILETEYDAELQERQIAGMDAFIAAINDRKAQL